MAINLVRASGQYVNLPYNATAHELGGSPFTITAWFSYSESLVDKFGSIIARWDSVGDKRRWDLIKLGSNRIQFKLSIDGTNTGRRFVTSNTVLSSNTTYHVAVVKDSLSDGNIYLDGVLDATLTLIGTIPTDATINTAIGSSKEAFSENPFGGKLWDIRIYTRELTSNEIKIIYQSRGADNITNSLVARYLLNEGPTGSNASNVLDSSTTGNNGTTTATPTYYEAEMKLVR